MRSLRVLPLLGALCLASGFAGTGCAALERSRSGSGPRMEAPYASASALAFSLRGQGFQVRGAGLARPLFADAAASAYVVEGGVLQVYEFESPEAARQSLARVQLDAVSGDPLSFYQREALIAVYNGRSMAVQNALSRALGLPQ